MARPREFDEAAALDAATLCFWARGYEATSIRNLTQSMGITGASLYNAFGDKRSLYQRVLDRYVECGSLDWIKQLEAQLPPHQAIAAFFEEIIERSLDDPQRKGCLLVNAAVEVAPHDLGFQQIVADVLIQIEAFFCRCVAAGQRAGNISIVQTAEDLARLLLGLLLGIRVLARVRPERDLLQGMVRPAFALLDCQFTAQETPDHD
ncbi:TetR/AcrR family transcriptional regulator [Pseudomonas sp. 10B1]|uniref:TetR/AcrR family transcriptional regulator n=1 Tax=unclassified Pseudomonas TaxID=196821 RepID=UPI002AB4887D|nr:MULTISPECIES: TetR/AcrR family transcriptional regulator [unclassified Pseudomonas]MDY7560619.1 TetR/AcrR family transcriptional regulator [Pseudomonas sp. AB6]MEA9976845.1 TetR/AcrR family transcriptional regulator [Pseudomonas sp. RTS4]MEA9993375.1 TetR/AcrR family transcriptional regulator [Pseudomonas sp. AA4]MEB0088375.1 TetR/AcrR family transcriptional regulator [Pseudomonas sp. RTI1]MEB0124138.1 TetR/AcrR family transcriptional regulator [Pseudomonas sp. CCC1.2]